MNYDEYYRTLKTYDWDIYSKAIQYGEGVSMTHDLDPKAAVAVEVALVMLACEILKVKP